MPRLRHEGVDPFATEVSKVVRVLRSAYPAVRPPGTLRLRHTSIAASLRTAIYEFRVRSPGHCGRPRRPASGRYRSAARSLALNLVHGDWGAIWIYFV